MTHPIDHGLFARQIALTELGVEGQRRLAEVSVTFHGCPPETVAMYQRAGGAVATESGEVVVSMLAAPIAPGPTSVGLAGWAATEAARRVLGQPSVALSSELLTRLRTP